MSDDIRELYSILVSFILLVVVQIVMPPTVGAGSNLKNVLVNRISLLTPCSEQMCMKYRYFTAWKRVAYVDSVN